MTAADWAALANYLGAGLCMGLGALGAALGEGATAGEAAAAIARQPRAADPLLRTMLVGQAVAESASIFALVVAILLLFTPVSGDPPGAYTAAVFAAGLCMGGGALGAGLGAGLASQSACAGLGRNPRTGGVLTTTMLLGQAVAQTPAIFALLVAFLLLFGDYSAPGSPWTRSAALLGAGVAAGAGAVGPGLGAGLAAAAACTATARAPQRAALLLRTMLVGQAISQSTSIYALVVALILLYVV